MYQGSLLLTLTSPSSPDMTTTYFPLYVSMHASVCTQATYMCTCVSGHTSACMSMHRYACRYTHELPNASMIVVCIYTHMSAHIARYGCTQAGTHNGPICSGMHMHRYGATERQFSTALLVPLCLRPEIWLCLILVYQEASLGPFLVGLRLSGAST